MATLYLGLRLKSRTQERVTLDNVDLNDTVDSVRQKAAAQSNTTPEKIELVHCGVVLKGSDSLSDAGITSGSMIHCFPRSERSVPGAAPLSLPEVQTLLVALRNVTSRPNFRDFVQKLRRPDMVEKILASCPIVRHDPAALAMLQDPELFLGLTNPDNLTKLVESWPEVGRVAQYVTSLSPSEAPSPRRSHHVSYSMDALSDDDQMEADQSEDSTGGGDSRASGSVPFQPITPAQLAAALASATGGGGGGGGGSSSSTNNGGVPGQPTSAPRSIPTTPSIATTTPFNTPAFSVGGPTGPGPITQEMFSNALQNALAASASRSVSSQASGPPSSASSGPPSTVQIPNIEESLQLMREMGIPNEDLSREALQATNGDVQAAVNLIFAQWMADD
ncbi:ubiquitin-like protein 7 isoform X3 [Portunus trituberculatus]|uniref:ubiquitin-like protein 7 isoform X3 n=1 Tax=Portunus trituberculatus TaxID=210409 RepID=UPI001E1CB1FA|nr:ubiquitin-like protein 7 isoform X3 [Portunus trituberculatus]